MLVVGTARPKFLVVGASKVLVVGATRPNFLVAGRVLVVGATRSKLLVTGLRPDFLVGGSVQ